MSHDVRQVDAELAVVSNQYHHDMDEKAFRGLLEQVDTRYTKNILEVLQKAQQVAAAL